MAEQMLRQLMREVKSLRSDVQEIRIAVNEIDEFQHRAVKPEYVKKLKKIKSQKGNVYNSIEEFDRDLNK